MLFVPQWLFSTDPNAYDPATTSGDDEVEELSLSARLEYYKAHGERPPSSRIDPFLEQRVHNAPLSLVNLWKYGAFLATKATDIASDLLRHQLVGARKKSWGLEMTILSALMRNMGHHSSLADLRMLRRLLAVGTALTPVVPGDALVTPVTFRAKQRGLRGFLAEVDAREDGRRIIGGEWVVCRALWLRLQDQWRKAKRGTGTGAGAGTTATAAAAAHSQATRAPTQSRVILFLHGGAYYMFSPATHRTVTIPLSKQTESRVFAVDYRLAPETRFPGQLHDAVLAYLRLIEDLDIPPGNVVVCGDSAGGGLALALLLYLRDNSYPLPSACILMSPWVDLTMSCDSWDSNAEFDLVPIPQSGDHLNPILCLLGPDGLSNQYLTHPYASPLFGQMHGLPPLLIQSGDAEVLRDEAMLLAHKATLAGVKVRHEIYEDQVHVFQMFFFLDAAKKALLACREFLHGLADDPSSMMRHKHTISGVAISGTEKASSFINNAVSSEFNEKKDLPMDGPPGPEEMSKEVEARLEREIAGKGSRVMIVRGDGTVVDDDATAHGAELLMTPSRSSSEESPTPPSPSPSGLGSRSTSSIAGRSKQDPHVRDGTTVDHGARRAADEDPEFEEPDSPISFKPRRRSPAAAAAAATTEKLHKTPSIASIGNGGHHVGIRAKTPIIAVPPTARRRTSGYFSNSPNNANMNMPMSTSPTKNKGRPRSGSASSQPQPYAPPSHPSVLTRNNSISNSGLVSVSGAQGNNTSISARHLSRRRTQMHLGLTTASPHNPHNPTNPSVNAAIASAMTTPAPAPTADTISPLLSPSIPSIRKRERATSHPDIFRLCQSWAELGPANDLVVIEANPQPHITDA